MAKEKRPPALIVYGPTASGKSAYAMRLAEKQRGVIINADVMQLYRPFPVLTAQPTREDKDMVPHRLYGELDPDSWCNAQKWRGMALTEIERAHAQNQMPIITGGTGFYILALLKGIAEMPAVPAAVREDITARLAAKGHETLHAELQNADPVIAAKIKINDTQRLIRALEVFEATNIPLSEWQRSSHSAAAPYDFTVHLLLPERAQLYDNINKRASLMIEHGALDEVQNLINCPAEWPVYKSHGFREFRDYLRTQSTLEEAIEKTRQATRNYAKRQMTWARHQMSEEKLNCSVIRKIES